MRARLSTDDYLELDGQLWDIMDTSVGKSIFCGVCTGHALYGSTPMGGYISYVSYLVVEGGRLRIHKANSHMYPREWRARYDRFVSGRGIDDDVPYSGWMLITRGSQLADRFAGLLDADDVAELRFEGGRLVERYAACEAVKALNEEFPGLVDFWGVWLDGEYRSRVQKRARELFRGDYNCIRRNDGEVAKQLKWGFSNHEREYDCAVCAKLRENEVLPVRKPKRPRKKKYRQIGYQVPRFLPQWVHELAEAQGILQGGKASCHERR